MKFNILVRFPKKTDEFRAVEPSQLGGHSHIPSIYDFLSKVETVQLGTVMVNIKLAELITVTESEYQEA